MAFNSILFLVYFPAVLGLYFLLPVRLRPFLLLIASLLFYAAWRPPYLILFLGAISVSYYVGLKIHAAADPAKKKALLWAGITVLLGNLFFFKYFNFANDSLRAVFQWVSLPYDVPNLNLLLPIGISFYTFQKLSYLIDVYKGAIPPERSLFRFTLFASFFPQLVAGPIERAKDLLPQMHCAYDFDYARIRAGLQLMLWGFFKKVVIADRLAPFVEDVYGSPRNQDGVSVLLATFFFVWQVYCDFSGYSDIAIGAAQTLGITLTKNFNRPYFATSIQDFWKRWHITLSTWLTEYVYTPLTRTSLLKVKWFYMILGSLFLTFLASGVWHGANWTFVIWGALHGIYLVSSLLSKRFRANTVKLFRLTEVPRLHTALRVAFTFTLVMFSDIFFRANNVGDAGYLVGNLFSGWGGYLSGQTKPYFAGHLGLLELALALYGIAVLLAVEWLQARGGIRERLALRPAWVRWSIYYAQLASVVLLGAYDGGNSQFIYFQF